nr:U-box domain-containing protein 35-like [Tanacetum cinerariifolium]
MLRVKLDVYSLGIMLLQMVTAIPALGLTHHVENTVEKGTLCEMLDTSVPDWPQDKSLGIAKRALQCAELRQKDRSHLRNVVFPKLARLRNLGQGSMPPYTQ